MAPSHRPVLRLLSYEYLVRRDAEAAPLFLSRAPRKYIPPAAYGAPSGLVPSRMPPDHHRGTTWCCDPAGRNKNGCGGRSVAAPSLKPTQTWEADLTMAERSLTTKRVVGAARCLPWVGIWQEKLLEPAELFQAAGSGPTELFCA